MSQANLLIELLTEELPPRALKGLSEQFARLLVDSLVKQGLAKADAKTSVIGTPRRLGVWIADVAACGRAQQKRHKLMPVSVGLDSDGQPTPALRKKLAALGLDALAAADLQRESDGKNEVLIAQVLEAGVPLQAALQTALNHALDKLPIAKVMSYQLTDGHTTVRFIRPARSLLALHGASVVEVQALGLSAGRSTAGHRFLSEPRIEIAHADDYFARLERAKVLTDFAARRARITTQAQQLAQQSTVLADEALLDEVSALTEWPTVLLCQFDAAFLDVPQECLILTMQANQRYFPLADASGKLLNRFLIVANVDPSNTDLIRAGNERVVTARLNDARFFYQQDRKHGLLSREPRLAQIVYHNQLGSLAERVARITTLANAFAQAGYGGQATPEQVQQAARLAKLDLVSEMVGEFPELQGTMGRYYALAEHYSAEVAEALQEQYLPRFSGDRLPSSAVACTLALADKMELLAGLFAIGQTPTGDKDPFGLRRAALGVIRIVLEKGLRPSLPDLISQAFALFPQASDQEALLTFMQDRLRGYLRETCSASAEQVEAVLHCVGRQDLLLLPARIRALQQFLPSAQAPVLIAAAKRIRNILDKAQPSDESAVMEYAPGAEHDLAQAVQAVKQTLTQAQSATSTEFVQSLQALTQLAQPIDRFFADVMVMVDDAAERNRRLHLLREVHALMSEVANLAYLPG